MPVGIHGFDLDQGRTGVRRTACSCWRSDPQAPGFRASRIGVRMLAHGGSDPHLSGRDPRARRCRTSCVEMPTLMHAGVYPHPPRCRPSCAGVPSLMPRASPLTRGGVEPHAWRYPPSSARVPTLTRGVAILVLEGAHPRAWRSPPSRVDPRTQRCAPSCRAHRPPQIATNSFPASDALKPSYAWCTSSQCGSAFIRPIQAQTLGKSLSVQPTSSPKVTISTPT